MNNTNNNQHIHQHWGRVGRALLNSLIGEYLDKERNPLAIQMGFYQDSIRLSLERQLAHQLRYRVNNRVVVFIHGHRQLESSWDYSSQRSSSSESQIRHYIEACFQFNNADAPETYGSKLHDNFGYTPFFLRYNTGLSEEKNGLHLSKLLNELDKKYPCQISELMLVGFDMGSALIRHAQRDAQKNGYAWLNPLSKCVYLGQTPFPQKTAEDIASRSRKRLLSLAKGQNTDKCLVASSRHFFVQHQRGSDHHGFSAPHDYLSEGLSEMVPSNSQLVKIESKSPVHLMRSEQVYSLIAKWVVDSRIPMQAVLPAAEGLSRPGALAKQGDKQDQGNAFVAGAISLAASIYDKTLEKLETLHYAFAEGPFYVAQRLPLVSQVTNPVESLHRNMLDRSYRTLRLGGRMMHQRAWMLTQTNSPQHLATEKQGL